MSTKRSAKFIEDFSVAEINCDNGTKFYSYTIRTTDHTNRGSKWEFRNIYKSKDEMLSDFTHSILFSAIDGNIILKNNYDLPLIAAKKMLDKFMENFYDPIKIDAKDYSVNKIDEKSFLSGDEKIRWKNKAERKQEYCYTLRSQNYYDGEYINGAYLQTDLIWTKQDPTKIELAKEFIEIFNNSFKPSENHNNKIIDFYYNLKVGEKEGIIRSSIDNQAVFQLLDKPNLTEKQLVLVMKLHSSASRHLITRQVEAKVKGKKTLVEIPGINTFITNKQAVKEIFKGWDTSVFKVTDKKIMKDTEFLISLAGKDSRNLIWKILHETKEHHDFDFCYDIYKELRDKKINTWDKGKETNMEFEYNQHFGFHLSREVQKNYTQDHFEKRYQAEKLMKTLMGNVASIQQSSNEGLTSTRSQTKKLKI